MAAKNVKNFEIKLGKRALVIFITGMSCLLFTCFIFGVMVGKDMDAYPEKYSAGMINLAKNFLGLAAEPVRVQADVPMDRGVDESPAGKTGDIELTFYDTLGKKGKQGNDVVPAAPVPPSVPILVGKPAAPPIKKEAATDAKTDSKRTTRTAAASVGVKSRGQIKKGTEKTEKGQKKYLVQVVSLKEKAKAEQLARTLSSSGYNPRVVALNIPDKGKMYRVTLNNYESREKAEKVAAAVKNKIKGVNCIVRAEDKRAGKKD